MNFKPIYLAVGVLLLAAILFAVNYLAANPASDLLTEKETKALIEERYKGKVLDIKKVSGAYWIELERTNGVYKIEMDASKGEILSFEKSKKTTPKPEEKMLNEENVKGIIEANETGKLISLKKIKSNEKAAFLALLQEEGQKVKVTIDAVSGKILSREIEEVKPASKLLTEDQAVQHALKELPGKVDDIDFEAADNTSYYFVEIETADNREAVVQINAITGGVMSVTWDD
ncbi:PepSY domain-containing protein [Bacillus sp. J33]|uniref:PepSY domain-containing protein n=1 Tax=Bacillus sp. J33 TaxID=935836 RepID=UPI000479D01B|nr:PepSY domain-containing protein [Bacillus sp. J33]